LSVRISICHLTAWVFLQSLKKLLKIRVTLSFWYPTTSYSFNY